MMPITATFSRCCYILFPERMNMVPGIWSAADQCFSLHQLIQIIRSSLLLPGETSVNCRGTWTLELHCHNISHRVCGHLGVSQDIIVSIMLGILSRRKARIPDVVLIQMYTRRWKKNPIKVWWLATPLTFLMSFLWVSTHDSFMLIAPLTSKLEASNSVGLFGYWRQHILYLSVPLWPIYWEIGDPQVRGRL